MTTINQKLIDAVKVCPDKVFIQEDNKKLTFHELNDITDGVASNLLALGLQRGDKIGILALNQSEWLISYFAATKIGLGVVALSVRYRNSELKYMINHSEIKAMISVGKTSEFDFASYFAEEKENFTTVEHFIFIGDGFKGSLEFSELLNHRLDEQVLKEEKQKVNSEDLAIMIYTSGTTGNPKGVMITHHSILASAQAEVDHLLIDENDVILQNLPLNHVGGITCQVTTALLSKGKIVLIPEFKVNLVLQVLQEEKVTILLAVPTMYQMLFANSNFKQYDLSNLRFCIVGGSNVEPSLAEQLNELISNAQIICLYGLSESSGACILSKIDDSLENVQTTIGVMIGSFKGKVMEVNKREVPFGELGELVIKGSCLAKGYYNDLENTKNTFSEDGWLYTGDMVTMNQQGYISFKGRKKEIYIQGGFNILPVEIENLLTQHPAIQMAAGIGVPDDFYGEVGRYYIVLNPEMTITKDEITDYCKENLADYKVPKQIVFVETLPMTPAGKIQKSKLKQEALDIT